MKKPSRKTLKKTVKRSTLPKKTLPSHQVNFFKTHERDLQLILIPLILVAIWGSIFLTQQSIQKQAAQQVLDPLPFSLSIHSYPLLQNLMNPTISAQAGIIMDDTSKAIIYAKNPDLHFSMASTTKLMTALVGSDYYKLSDVLTTQIQQVEGVNVGLRIGEQMTFQDMLYAMLLPSGNDVAYNIAANYPGGVAAFVAKMNEKVLELHLGQTHYGDPAGLNDDEDYTTARDLALLASAFIKNPTLAKVVGTKNKVVATLNTGHQFTLANLNRLLGINGVTGLKTGSTEGAGEVLVTSKVENGRTFIIVVMKSTDRFKDTENLLTLLTNNISFFMPHSSNSGL